MKRIGFLAVIFAVIALFSCDDRSSSLIYLKPRVQACMEMNGGDYVRYHGWPLEEQFSLEVIGEFDVDGEARSGLLYFEIPSREEVLAIREDLPVCRDRKDEACADRNDDYVIASYKEFDVDHGGDPVPVFDSTLDGADVEGSLRITETAEEFNYTRLRGTFDVTFHSSGRTRTLSNGGLGLYTLPPADTGECPEEQQE